MTQPTMLVDGVEVPVPEGIDVPVAAIEPRVIPAEEFLQLFTPAEVAALWTADPRLMTGALKVAAQGTCNLDSPDAAALLGLAVAKGAITSARMADVLAGNPPTP